MTAGEWARRLGAATATRVARDFSALFGPLLQALRTAQYQRLWLGPFTALLIVAFAIASRTAPGHAWLEHWAIMRAGDPWMQTLSRVPLSPFAPAHLLPYWASMLQAMIVIGGAQALIGTRRTLTVALTGHLLGSLSARLWIWIGPPIGLPEHYLRFADAGPSVATMALGAYLAVRFRAGWIAALLLGFHVAEWITVDGLAQREHVVGVLVGGAAAAGPALARTLLFGPAQRRRASMVSAR